MFDRSRKHPKNTDELGKLIIDLSVSAEELPAVDVKNPAAVALGRLGGKKGCAARAASLSAGKRKKIAKAATNAKWGKQGKI